MSLLLKENKTLQQLLSKERSPPQIGSILKCIVESAEQNCTTSSHQYRHKELIIKFAISLYIYSGPLAYNFLHSNMPLALPSLQTVERKVNANYAMITEGSFRFDELVAHLKEYNAPPLISIGEDATRVIARVDYDLETDKLVGFVLPLQEDSLPITNSFPASSLKAIEDYFHTATVAKYAFLYMAQPLLSSAPAFILACMGTDNKFTAEHVLKRWQFIQDECIKRGIMIVSFGADGDPEN